MNKPSVSLLMLIAALAVAAAGYSDCGSQIGSITSLEITDCKDADTKCVLHRNTNASVKITFSLKENVDKVKAVVHGILMDVPVPFALPNSDGCLNSGLACPLQSGQSYTYEATLPVLKKYPRVTVDVKWELQSGDGKDIVCLLIPAKIE